MKSQLLKITSSFSKLIPLPILIQLTKQYSIFPFYHTVSDYELVHIKHLYPVKTKKAFEKDIDYLLKYYKPINYKDIASATAENKKKEKTFLLSFDDGLKEFYDTIAPILLQKGVPAICFLNTAFVDNNDLFYRYKQSVLLDKLLNGNLSATQKKNIAEKLVSDKISASGNLSDILSISYQNRNKLDELAILAEIDFNAFLKVQQPYLTSVQINALIKQGFHFGGHSIDHPKYNEIGLEEQLRQTEISVKTVVKNFNLDYRLFSFPFTDDGVKTAFFEGIFATPALIDLSFACAGLKKDKVGKNIQRIPLEVAQLSAREIIVGEYIYYLLKSTLNKNTLNRK